MQSKNTNSLTLCKECLKYYFTLLFNPPNLSKTLTKRQKCFSDILCPKIEGDYLKTVKSSGFNNSYSFSLHLLASFLTAKKPFADSMKFLFSAFL